MNKQETLEEVAEKFIKKQNFNSLEIDDKIFEAILFGAKWQAERMYDIIDEYVNDVMGGCNLRFKEWFEQYKKK